MYNSSLYNESPYGPAGSFMWGLSLADTLPIGDNQLICLALKVIADSFIPSDSVTKESVQSPLLETLLATDISIQSTNKEIADALTTTDILNREVIARLNDSTVALDNDTYQATHDLDDFLLLNEIFKREISNKALSELIKLGAWLTVKRTNPADWIDQ